MVAPLVYPWDDRPVNPRKLGLLDAIAIIVGIIIGSGIFVAPAGVARASGSFGLAMVLWLVAALVSAAGALTYAECSSRLPEDGGFFVFYRTAYGQWLAFTSGWAAQLVTYPAAIAALAHVAANYTVYLIPHLAGAQTAVAAGWICLSGVLNGLGVRSGANAQRILTASKVIAICALCVAAAFAGEQQLTVLPRSAELPSATVLLGALLVLLWTYDGWSDFSLIAGIMRDPGRDLVRGAVISMLLLAVLYGLVQAAVLSVLTVDEAAASTSVFSDAAVRALGPLGGKLVAALVVVSAYGSLHGIVFTVSRLAPAMARKGDFLPWFAKVDPVRGLSLRALGFVVIASTGYAVAADFELLLRFFGQTVWIFYGLTGVALLLFRRRGVGEQTAVRVPSWAPVVLVTAALALTSSLAIEDPRTFLSGVGLVSLGIPVFFLWNRVRTPQK
ncbi:MAG: amino acid permease [Myxococcota bacterium]